MLGNRLAATDRKQWVLDKRSGAINNMHESIGVNNYLNAKT